MIPPLPPSPLDVPPPRGRLVDDVVDSPALRGNPLGDPHRRRLLVWLPPGYEEEPTRRYPVVYVLPGYGASVERWCHHDLFSPSVFFRLERMYAEADAPPPCIYAFVDGATAYGGSQFVNSSATGRYEDYVADDVVAHVDATYRTLADPGHRGVGGHSSGGVGALSLAMRRPDVFGACASHAGDALFEHCYGRELGDFARALRECDGDVVRLRDRLLEDELYRAARFGVLMVLGCAAAYSPDPAAPLGIGLPVDVTGRLVEENWRRWLEADPVRLAPRHAEALRGLRAVYLDSGDDDEYYMDLGAAALSRVLEELGVAHRYERRSGRHGPVGPWLPRGWAHLARALAAP